MKQINLLLIGFGIFFLCEFRQTEVSAGIGSLGDCFWGGRNESTTYTPPYVSGMGGSNLNQVASPPVNLGAPPPAIPVQASPGTQAISIPQANIPTITVPTGQIGTVGQPATSVSANQQFSQLPPGTEIMYVLPSGKKSEEQCLNGTPGTPLHAVQVVSANTPGAIPVAVKAVTVQRPKIEYHWSYSPIREKTETLVRVVNPKTGRVVRTFCRADERQSILPYPHQTEVVSYESVTVKVATPIQLAPSASATANTAIYQPNPTADSQPNAGMQRSNRFFANELPLNSDAHTTLVLPE